MQSNKYCLLFGGAFDPPHVGHLNCLKIALKSGYFSEIIIVPTGADRYDRKAYADTDTRLKLLKIFIEENFLATEKIKIDQVQISGKINSGSKTIDLINYFQVKSPNKNYGFMIGSDLVSQVKGWQNFSELVSKLKFFCVTRGGYQINYPDFITPLVSPEDLVIECSSTKIREAVIEKNDFALSSYLTPKVKNYIQQNLLYLT